MVRASMIAAPLLALCFAAVGTTSHAVTGLIDPHVNLLNGPQTESVTFSVSNSIKGSATLQLTFYGDLDAASESIAISIDGQPIGTVFNGNPTDDPFNTTGDVGNQCGSLLSLSGVIDEATLAPLIADGSLTLTFTSTVQVNNFCTDLGPFSSGGVGLSFGVQGTLSFDPDDTAQTAVQSLTTSRASVALANIPTLSGRMSGGGSTVSGSGGDANGSISFSTSLSDMRRAAAMSGDDGAVAAFGLEDRPSVDFWIGGSYTYFESDFAGVASQGDVGMLQLGIDTRLSDTVLVGVAAFGDLLSSDVVTGVEASGVGFMAGPYAVLSLNDNLYVEGLAAVGQAFNEVDDPAVGSAEYDSERLLVTARVSGDFRYDAWSLRPATRVTYYAERQEEFLDGGGTLVPESTTELGQLRFGPEIAYDLEMIDGPRVRPFFGAEGVWAFLQTEQLINGARVAADDFSASVSAGFDANLGPASLRAAGRYDGLGAEDFDAITGELQVRIPLN